LGPVYDCTRSVGSHTSRMYDVPTLSSQTRSATCISVSSHIYLRLHRLASKRARTHALSGPRLALSPACAHCQRCLRSGSPSPAVGQVKMRSPGGSPDGLLPRVMRRGFPGVLARPLRSPWCGGVRGQLVENAPCVCAYKCVAAHRSRAGACSCMSARVVACHCESMRVNTC